MAADPQQGNGQTGEEFADAAIQANAILGVKGGSSDGKRAETRRSLRLVHAAGRLPESIVGNGLAFACEAGLVQIGLEEPGDRRYHSM